jgi:hypothetical protein
MVSKIRYSRIADRPRQLGCRDPLLKVASPIAVPALAAAFSGHNTPRRRERVEQVLETLLSTGAARRDEATNGSSRGNLFPGKLKRRAHRVLTSVSEAVATLRPVGSARYTVPRSMNG